MKRASAALVVLALSLVAACQQQSTTTALPTVIASSTPAASTALTTPVATRGPSATPTRTSGTPPPATASVASRVVGSETARAALENRLTVAALRDAEYTICSEEVRLRDGEGITEKPGLDYARQCKVTFDRFVLGDLNGDSFADALVILYTFERSHRIPSAHILVDAEGSPSEVAVRELAWEKEVAAASIANTEGIITLSNDGPAETVRLRIP